MTVEEYLEQAPEPQRTTLNELRASLRQILPDATETISYGKPALKVNDRAVAGYAYYKDHCSYFPHSGTVLSELADEIDGYEWSKGTLKFPADQPLPLELVTRLVEVRLGQLSK